MTRRPTLLGFTLLEVMVAVAILGVGLTAIFSSQVGAMRVGNRARRTELGTILARCKMAEVEEKVLVEGLPAIEASGRDECCEGAEVDGYHCRWAIERITLPEVPPGMGGGQQNGPQRPGATPDPTAMLAGAASVGDFLTGGGGPGGGFSGLAMNLAFPVLKPQIEEQVRRATVTVEWSEGERTQSFDVVYFLVSPLGTIQQAAAQQAVSTSQSSTGSSTGGTTQTGGR